MDHFFAKQLLGSDFNEERGAFVASLFKSAKEGHLCLRASSAPSLPASLIYSAPSCFEEERNFPEAPVICHNDKYYLQKNYVLETYFLKLISKLLERKPALEFDRSCFMQRLSQENAMNPEQSQVIKHLFDHPFSICCGGPGTGKTYTAGLFVRLLLSSRIHSEKEFRIVLAAPTGKAALHLQSSIISKNHFGKDVICTASTLHRLLKLKPGEIRLFARKRIDADLIIVDEASMMDLTLFTHLLESIGEGTRLVLMGDPNQLPPVEQTGLFAECAHLWGVYLKRCMRTEDLKLKQSAEAILKGDAEMLFSSVSISEEFDDKLIDRLYKKMNPCLSKDPIDPWVFMRESTKIRMLNALRQGPFGLEEMNQKTLARMERECKEGEFWAIPILATANLPHLNLYNGTPGVLIGQKKNKIRLYEGRAFFQETGPSPLLELPPYEISFFLSIHKSQGSEFDEVIAILPEGSENFGKEALYTAATRAKTKWEIIGKKSTIERLLAQRFIKTSGFVERINGLPKRAPLA